MKIKELRMKTETELRTMLNNDRKEYLTLSFEKHYSRLKDMSRFGKLKREIATIETLLKEQSKKVK